MFLGVDLGTSAVKAVLVDDADRVIDQASAPLELSRPHPLWSEQDPDAWWAAACGAITALRGRRAAELGAVRAIGLAGQMHGAVLLDARDRVLRPAILWNDGRSVAECAELERRAPDSRRITGNLAMPGFTAPKLLWVRAHEPASFARVARVLLPKDMLRLRMTGEHVSEMSDAAGTLWLDVARRCWSRVMLEATGLDERAMPRLVEGTEPSGQLRAEVAAEWGVPPGAIVAGGAGDNAAGAVGVGVVSAGRALLSLGTSGVYFVATDRFAPCPERAVHAFCHALPRAWHQMSVILSAASAVGWVTTLTGAESEGALLAEVEREAEREHGGSRSLVFLPYLSGERTPHNDPNAKGVFFGMTHETTRASLARAVLEGVAFALADGQDALLSAGTHIDDVTVIGGGAKSALWGRILAATLDRPLAYRTGGDVGPGFGAARLARIARTGEDPVAACPPPPLARVLEPDRALRERLLPRLELYRALYRALQASFSSAAKEPVDD